MILVTGATGHIGNVLVQRLLSQGARLRALVLRDEDTTPLDGLQVELVEGDVLELQSLKTACDGVQEVYHLAGLITIMPGENRLVQRVNVEGTRNMLQAAEEAGVRRFVYTSSIHAIQRAPHGTLIDEKLPYDPHNPYGAYDRSKAQASLLVQAAARQGLNAVIACPTGVIGPYDYRRSEMGALICACALGAPQLYVEGAYDFVDVRDVAEGLVRVCQHGRTGESYILSGQQISVPGLLSAIQTITGKRLLKMKIPMQVARIFARITPLYYRLARQEPRFTPYSLEVLCSNSYISHAKARLELGYQPRPLYDCLVDTVEWFTTQPACGTKPSQA